MISALERFNCIKKKTVTTILFLSKISTVTQKMNISNFYVFRVIKNLYPYGIVTYVISIFALIVA